MPVFLSALAIALASSTSISSVTTSISISQKSTNLPTKNLNSVLKTGTKAQEVSLSKSLASAIDNFKDYSNLSDQEIKAIIEKSIISDNDGNLSFNLDRLQGFESTEFFQIIASNKDLSKKMLSKLSESGLLQYIAEANSFQFKEPQQLATFNSRIWAVHKWSWFAYWELHFDHSISKLLYYVGENGGEIIDFIEAIGEVEGLWAIGLSALGFVCKNLAIYFGERDQGNGVCIRWDLAVPRDVVAR